jgi:phosphonate transport system ATP-binding protein
MDLSGTAGKTLIMNLHSVDLALAYFPRIVGFRDGRVAFDRSPAQVSDDLLASLYAGSNPSPMTEESPDAEAAVRGCAPVFRPQ